MANLTKAAWLFGVAIALGAFAPPAAFADAEKVYQVQEGNKVDNATLEGWRTWRALACERCHGNQQQGLVGPSLIDALKRLSREEFKTAVLKGRPEKGMPNFDGSKMVTENIDGLYAYLKGRSDGAIKPGHVYPMK
jgi:mono/diheme cytochrome c family protein